MLNPIVLIIALFISRFLGELPEKIHPVVLIGKLIYFLSNSLKSTNSKNKIKDFIFGSLTTLLVIFVVFAIIYFINLIVNNLNNIFIKYIVYSVLLATTIGYKSLLQFSKTPLDYIKNNNIEKAKKSVQCIVSRDTANLDKKQIMSASIESMSENITDSIIAPLFYAILFGIEGAFIYRTINTLDGMIGYRNKKYEYYGKLAAILDDIANFIPSRLAGLLLVISSPLYRGNIKNALTGYIKEGNKTPSPNSGYTMATIANSLNMELEKINCYKLGKGEITLKKAYNSLLAVDIVVILFLIIYILIYIYYIKYLL